MALASGTIPHAIAKRGFRRWYERELLAGHANLVLLIFATLGVMGAMEAFSYEGGERVPLIVSVLVAAAVGVWALRRYLSVLARAELIANQAVCPECQAYGRFEVEYGRKQSMQVRCRACGHHWSMEW